MLKNISGYFPRLMQSTSVLASLWLVLAGASIPASSADADKSTPSANNADRASSVQTWWDLMSEGAPTSSLPSLRRGNVYMSSGKYKEAIEQYSVAIELHPKHACAYRIRGLAYVCSNQVEKAIADYSTAITIDPRHAWTYCNRGHQYSRKSDHAKAISDFSKAIRLEPDHAHH